MNHNPKCMDNLISLKDDGTLTKEQKERNLLIASMGGKASQAKKKKEKTLRESALLVLNIQFDRQEAEQLIGSMADKLEDKDLTAQTFMGVAMVKEAMNGNAKAFEVLQNASGQSKMELSVNGNLDVLTSTDRAILTKMRQTMPSFSQNDEETES